jgi:formamidopyrimidine-DNA glycosylase
MPELPEVETIVKDLNKKVKNHKVVDVWCDWPKYFSAKGRSASGGKLPKSQKQFKKCVANKKIKKVSRRGKNILIELSGDYILLIHQKMTGHMLYGNWVERKNFKGNLEERWEKEKWIPNPPKGNLIDPKNRFIRLIFFLDNKKMLALSDMRRFAKIMCGTEKEILTNSSIKNLGPEPLDTNYLEFKKLFKNKKGIIKPVLMDQSFIVGIGNIYADEILYRAKIHPTSKVGELKEKQLRAIYNAIKTILKDAIRARGTSIDDFRDAGGKKGKYEKKLLVYRQTGRKCPKGHIVERIKIGGRGTHFCPKEQKLYT